MAAANAHHRCGAVNLRSKQSRFYLYLWMQVKNDDDLQVGQRSSEVKCGKLCYQTWLEEQQDDCDLHGGQRPTEVKYSE